MAHLRIDDGVKRGPRKKVDRQPKAAKTGQYMSCVPAERRKAIVQDSYLALVAGETTDQIAARHGIPGRTLRHWLLDDPEAHDARRILINGELTRTLEEMREAKNASSPLPLACAREEFRAWSWIAERRESKLYGQRTHNTVEVVSDLGDRLRRAKERVIDGEVVADEPQKALEQA
jgi:hypothetical protein